MPRRTLPVLLIAIGAACADRDLPSSVTNTPPPTAPSTAATPRAARERLTERLARAMADPAVRASFKRRFDASRAPEQKLQFQALARADQTVLLAALARSASSVQEVLGDLAAARALEVYLPVAAHRAGWDGGPEVLVATIERDGEAPVAFDLRGNRYRLDPTAPPRIPVIALVPQETDFTNGRPHLSVSCWDYCDGGDGGSGGGGGSGGATPPPPSGASGLYVTASHFEESHESWLKGKPEYEYHVYGVDASGEAEQLACTGEHAGGPFVFDQNDRDWNGSAMLLSEVDRAAYEQRHPGKPVRVVAFEDDDEACVARIDGNRLAALLSAVDAAYRSLTSGKVEPWLFRGIKAAPTVFNLLRAVRNAITTGDDFIGNAVEASVVGWVPGGANWALKTEGTRTTGWFVTEYR